MAVQTETIAMLDVLNHMGELLVTNEEGLFVVLREENPGRNFDQVVMTMELQRGAHVSFVPRFIAGYAERRILTMGSCPQWIYEEVAMILEKVQLVEQFRTRHGVQWEGLAVARPSTLTWEQCRELLQAYIPAPERG